MPIKIQNRIIIGVTFFVGIMLLVGWIAINESGRMQAFTGQYSGRSIENGASIFVNNCSTCHGLDGKGQTGRAPALLNPMLFLDKNPAYDLTTVINGPTPPNAKAPPALTQQVKDAQATLNTLQATITTDQTNVTQAQAALNANTDATQKQTLQAALDKATSQLSRDQGNLPAVQKNADDLQKQLDQDNAQLKTLISQGWDPTRPARLNEVGWGGTLKDYITNAVAAGRPLSGSYWNGTIMPTWGQAYGGPLRADQVDDVVAYVLNFHDTAVTLTPKDVNQQFSLPQAQGAAPAGGSTGATSTDPKVFDKFPPDPKFQVDSLGDLKGGNATNGASLYQTLGCAGCHLAGAVGPITKGTYYRTVTTRLKDPTVTVKTPEAYLAQSILYPNAYIVPTYNANVMPGTFGKQITLTQLKDLIAYLETQNTP